MSTQSETFFTSVGCMDGRVQDVIAAYGQEKFSAKFPDTITEAGMVGLIAKKDLDLLEGLKFKVTTVSIGKHRATGVVVHGHAECAGNPVSDKQQKEDIRVSTRVISLLTGDVPVVGVFVKRSSDNPSIWVAEEV